MYPVGGRFVKAEGRAIVQASEVPIAEAPACCDQTERACTGEAVPDSGGAGGSRLRASGRSPEI